MPFRVPRSVAVCPICDADVWIEEIQEWEDFNGKVVIHPDMTTVSVNCETEPDIDGEGWDDWMRGHWNTPYIDWMPVQDKVTRWLQYNVPTSWNKPSLGIPVEE